MTHNGYESPTKRKGADGRTTDTSNIGKETPHQTSLFSDEQAGSDDLDDGLNSEPAEETPHQVETENQLEGSPDDEEESGELVVLQKLLGHHSVTITEMYAHLAPDYMQGAADIVGFTGERKNGVLKVIK